MSWKYDVGARGRLERDGTQDTTTTELPLRAGEGSNFTGVPRKLVMYNASRYNSQAQAMTKGMAEVMIQLDVTGDVIEVRRAQDGTQPLDLTQELRHRYVVENFMDVPMSTSPGLSVAAFGAVGDGVTDDTDAINDAFDFVENGGTVYFPAGDYNLSTWPDAGRNIQKRVTLEGEGTRSIISGPASALFLDVADQIMVRALTFEGWSKVLEFDPITGTEDKVTIEDCCFLSCDRPLSWTVPGAAAIVKDFSIRNCLFDTLTGKAIWMYGQWEHMQVVGCRFFDVTDNAIVLGRDVAADADHWKNTHICSNTIDTVAGTGANVRAIECFGQDANISGNTIRDVSGGTTETVGIHCLTERCAITNNILFDIDGSAGVRGIGIQQQGDSFGAEEPSSVPGYNCVIDGNVIDMNNTADSRGIYVANDNIVCSNNVIVGVRDLGITTDTVAGRTHENLVIDANKITFPQTGTPGTGIQVSMEGSNIIITNNVVVGSTRACVIQPSTGTPECYTITNNHFDAATTGIRFAASVKITGVKILLNHVTGATTGISFETTAPDVVQMGWNTFLSVTTDVSFTVTPTNLNRVEQAGADMEHHQKLVIKAGGLDIQSGNILLATGVGIYTGSGVPAGTLGTVGSIYLRTAGGVGATLYYKSAATTWTAVA